MSRQRNFWIPVICGAVILTIGIGARQSFGIFQKPIAADLHVGRELWSFGNALGMLLMGAFAPFAGNLADRFGTARTVGVGGALYVAGMLMIAFANEGVLLTLGNALAGIGMAAAGFGPILGAIGRQAPAEWKSFALGVATAGGSFGQFAIVPFASVLQNHFEDWHATMLVLAGLSLLMIPLAIGLRENHATGKAAAGAARQSSSAAVREAFSTQGFWLLTLGFFVCGFHVTFIGLHLPPYISDHSLGLSFFGRPVSAIELGGWAIGLVGLFNIAGSLLWGWLGGRHLRKDMLALLYALRALAFILFLALPLSWVSVLLFAATLGFLWLGTVPLTSGLVGYMFGPVHMSMLWALFSSVTKWEVSWAAGVPDVSMTSKATTTRCGGYRSGSECSPQSFTGSSASGRCRGWRSQPHPHDRTRRWRDEPAARQQWPRIVVRGRRRCCGLRLTASAMGHQRPYLHF